LESTVRTYGRPSAALLIAGLLIGCADLDSATLDDSLVDEADVESQVDQVSENERVILDFIEAWSRLDPPELASFFTDDGIYHNMPTQPVQGRANVEGLIRGFSASWTETTWDVLNIVSSGNVVIAERVDRTKAGDKSVDLPVVGVFEMEGGKIKVWRDYFDQGTYMRAMR
jgi:limonene-1,2-epoxide hydrolase